MPARLPVLNPAAAFSARASTPCRIRSPRPRPWRRVIVSWY